MKSKFLTKPILLSVLSGVLAGLSYPGYGLTFLVWIALIPFFMALKEAKAPKTQFWCGWRAGFAFFLVVLPWLLALWDWASVLIVFGYVALCAGLAIAWGFWAVGCGWFKRRPILLSLIAPSWMVLIDYIRGSSDLGFAWGYLGYALSDQLWIIQLASFTGIWGLSFLVVWINVNLWTTWDRKQPIWTVVSIVSIIALGAFGYFQQQQLSQSLTNAPEIRVAMIQPNIPQKEKSNPMNLERLRQGYQDLLETVTPSADLIVLPESMLPTLILDDFETFDILGNYASRNNAELLFGTFTRTDNELFNSVVLSNAQKVLLGQFDKVQLVPFSTEYFPLIEELKSIGFDQLLGSLPLGALTRGEGFTPLTGEHASIGAPICFETSFAFVSRAFVNEGANLLISVTNDAWFKDSVELEQHFAKGIIRAVETGRAFVQVANTGTTGAALPTGEVIEKLPVLEAVTGEVSVPLLTHQTVYAARGDWFVLWVLIIVAGCAVIRVFKPQSSQPST